MPPPRPLKPPLLRPLLTTLLNSVTCSLTPSIAHTPSFTFTSLHSSLSGILDHYRCARWTVCVSELEGKLPEDKDLGQFVSLCQVPRTTRHTAGS